MADKHRCDEMPDGKGVERSRSDIPWVAFELNGDPDGECLLGIIFCPWCGTKLEDV